MDNSKNSEKDLVLIDTTNHRMIPANIIANKRDGQPLSREEIRFMIDGFTSGEIPDYQMSALAMAIFFRGMSEAEILDLTQAMVASGDALKPIGSTVRVDKHSTGGLGDKTSLIIAPLLACLGYHVPMLSGRGLGITGGTLDKLEAIPGFRTNLEETEIDEQLRNVGCVITGATSRLAPADRKLYALRDVTATVPSIPLITASIMSKKIAESLNGLVLDVKYGSGSFQASLSQARTLAKALTRIGQLSGITTTALLTDMTQPLGSMIGNACEVLEALDVLQGIGPQRVRDLSIELAARLIYSLDPKHTMENVRTRLAGLLTSGEAFEKFSSMVRAQSGVLNNQFPLEKTRVILSTSRGILTGLDCQKIGYAVITMGGGRKRAGESINHNVGIRWLTPLGMVVHPGDTICEVFCNSDSLFEDAKAFIVDSLEFDKGTVNFAPLWME